MKLDLMKLRAEAPLEPASTRTASVVRERPPGAQLAEGFKSLLDEKIQDLAGITTDSARMDRDFAAGKTDNVHEVMVAAAKSSMAIDTAVQIRNLAVRAFNALTQLR